MTLLPVGTRVVKNIEGWKHHENPVRNDEIGVITELIEDPWANYVYFIDWSGGFRSVYTANCVLPVSYLTDEDILGC
jgi:hypothetical protein